MNFWAIHKHLSVKKIHKKCSFQIVNLCVCICVYLCVCVCVCVCVCACLYIAPVIWGRGGSGEASIFLNFEKLHQRLLHQSPNPLQLSTKSSSSKTAAKWEVTLILQLCSWEAVIESYSWKWFLFKFKNNLTGIT